MKLYQEPDFELIRLRASVITSSIDGEGNEGNPIDIGWDDDLGDD